MSRSTCSTPSSGAWIPTRTLEDLTGYDVLLRWASQTNVVDADTAARLDKLATGERRNQAAEHRRILALRETAYAALVEHSDEAAAQLAAHYRDALAHAVLAPCPTSVGLDRGAPGPAHPWGPTRPFDRRASDLTPPDTPTSMPRRCLRLGLPGHLAAPQPPLVRSSRLRKPQPSSPLLCAAQGAWGFGRGSVTSRSQLARQHHARLSYLSPLRADGELSIRTEADGAVGPMTSPTAMPRPLGLASWARHMLCATDGGGSTAYISGAAEGSGISPSWTIQLS